MSGYTPERIARAIADEQEHGIYRFSDLTRRCSRCRLTVDLLISELDPDTGERPAGTYLCADCDAGIYPDPREPRS